MSNLIEKLNKNFGNDPVARALWAEKKWVWVADKKEGYLAASITKEDGENLTVLMEDGTTASVNVNQTEKMNPPKYDRVEDMAELTHLNQASVIHNLRIRYMSNLIYTYSGLFCVTVNPYKKIAIYTDEAVRAYKGRKRAEMAPHVYCVADQAYHDMLNTKENQSILITGESGAGKTENTKKVIQYLASTASASKELSQLEKQILQANPILEAFGNAQTGKFIRIEFRLSGQVAGASIERYLLEKSRVTHQTAKERNYHIFYQLVKGGTSELKKKLLLDGTTSDYRFTKSSKQHIDGVDDSMDFKSLVDSFEVMRFTETEQTDLFRIIAAILHLGNITLQSERDDGSSMTAQSASIAEKICHVLGIPQSEFIRCLLKPQVKAGRDWVTQAKSVEQVYYSIEALARSMYERMFGELIDRINKTLYTSTTKQAFIGVLDIAGFEIFEINSFEQLCINYTNEKLQQFFNHHMFILEQEEYKRENIEWKFIDFGLDLQPTISLIEKSSPIGILSLLDEECVMPKATDKTFIDKLNGLWKGKSLKYDTPRFNAGFILQHYAGSVEYSVNGWLDKNKDPLNDNVTKLLANSTEPFVASIFADYLTDADDIPGKTKGITKKGAFRTVAQRHKEGLNSLMNQLHTTTPHFVRCIIPNEEKKPGKIDVNLVLEQLKCNGVLEGLRICRAGFPNRVLFQDFKSRYAILVQSCLPEGYIEGRQAAQLMLDKLNLDKAVFRIGNSKLAELENLRDLQLAKVVIMMQARIRGYLARKRFRRKDEQLRAIKIIQKNARIYVTLREWSWWRLYVKVKPFVNVSKNEEEMKRKDELVKEWETRAKMEMEERNKIEAARLTLEMEMKRIQELLLQEQHAANDMGEILSRTQQREVDLNDRLKEIIANLEERDSQIEQLLATKKKLDAEYRDLKSKSVADIASLDKLERERVSKEQRFKQIEEELQIEIERVTKLEADKKSAESQLNDLKVNLEISNTQLSDVTKIKNKLQANLKDAEGNLEKEQADKNKIESKRSYLDQEISQLKNMLADLEKTKTELEATLRKRDFEINSMNESLKQEGAAKDNIERQRRDLQMLYQTGQEEITNEKSEREKLISQKRKVEQELELLHAIMEQKGNEESKNSDIRRLRDQEISNNQNLLRQLEKELDDTRKKSNAAALQMSSELEQIRQESAAVQRAKNSVEIKYADIQKEFEKKEESCNTLEKNKRAIEAELEQLLAKIRELESSLQSMRAAKELLEKQCSSLTSKLEESESNNVRLDRDKQSLQRTVTQLQEEFDIETSKRQALETHKKRLSTELTDLQTRLDEEDLIKNENIRKLNAKSAELDSFKEKYNKEILERALELEDSRKRLEKDIIEINSQLEEASRNNSNLEKTKTRLNSEMEDLKLEVEREHTQTRNAERLLKQVEAQLNGVNIKLESERNSCEASESNVRKMQGTIDSLNLSLEERGNQIASIQKSKNDLDSELKALINEIGDGGKNIHDIERAKRRLEQKVEELNTSLEEEEGKSRVLEDARSSLEIRLNESRKNHELALAAKDQAAEETKRLLMKEVNSLGEQLDDANKQKNDLAKARRKLEDKLTEVSSQAENQAKGQSDLQKLKSKNDNAINEIKVRLEEAVKNGENYQELSQRHEKKANSLQAEIDTLEAQTDAIERSKKQLENKVSELNKELNEGDDSKASLLTLKKRLKDENATLVRNLDDANDQIATLSTATRASANDNHAVSSKAMLEYEEKISKLEESRRALLASQRLAVQELDDVTVSLKAAEKAKKQMMAEVDQMKSKYESEIVAKGEEVAARKKTTTELKEIQLRYDAELQKSNDLAESVAIYKSKLDQNSDVLEAAELNRLRSEKNEANLKAQIKELEDQLNQSNAGRRIAEDLVKKLEESNIELQDKLEDGSHELADLQVAKRKFQDELATVIDRHKADIFDRETVEEESRKKYQKEIKNMMTEIESEKNSSILFKEQMREMELETENLSNKLDAELRAAITWKREKEKNEIKLDELTRSFATSTRISEELQVKVSKLTTESRELKISLDEAEAHRIHSEKSRKSMENKMMEMEEEYSMNVRDKNDYISSTNNLKMATNELSELNSEYIIAVQVAEERVLRQESHCNELQAELNKERGINIELERSKMVLEKQSKEFTAKLLDAETSHGNRDTVLVKRLEEKISDLSRTLETVNAEKSEALKSVRAKERLVRELQFQTTEKDKNKVRLEDDQEKMEQKLKKMRIQLEELESSENSLQLAKRRAERDSSEMREKASRFEKELDKFKRSGLQSTIRTDGLAQ